MNPLRRGRPRRGLACAALLASVVACGCRSLPPARIARRPTAIHTVHLYVDRPFKVIPEPTPFIEGVLTAFRERLVLSGYDVSGVTYDLDDDEAVRADLLERNERVPGTAGIRLRFFEAPSIIGFGTAYRAVRCTVYDAAGQMLLSGRLDPPERRTLRELLLPPRHPDVEGRRWGEMTWRTNLAILFPPRGGSRASARSW
ncbi:MAG: hypothetical protein D6731_07335 [Planctomycetota bacterium]|nr:MAG: hypothetical protein D6731_07335 [Planctomycetota bacterium]